ncbi:RteC domain-containing protein [Alistipes onderdonkii]|nr:RteC domain-containing protein [Alistipes onderdonkii]
MRYYRSGLTNLAPPHYLRNRTDTAPYLESFYYERDPPFSITCDYKMISLIIENSLKFADRIGAPCLIFRSDPITFSDLWQRLHSLPCS